MKKLLFYLAMLLFIVVTSCSKDDNTTGHSITVNGEVQTLGADKNSKLVIDFTSTAAWKAELDVDWAILTQTSGQSGDNTISIVAKEENRIGEERTGTLKLSAADAVKEIMFFQEGKDIVNIEQNIFEFPAEGGQAVIKFTTNVSGALISIEAEEDFNWIVLANEQSRIMEQGSVIVDILANEGRENRTAKIVLAFANAEGNTLAVSPAITINQKGVEVGISTDYSNDRQACTIQTHSKGNGIPLVFMGDGFIDKEIESGLYEKAMMKGLDHFFSEEPIKSLKEYFDIYIVKAVSANNAFGGTYSTCFSATLAGGGSTLITGNNEKVINYARAVDGININEVTCIVILNTEEYAGTCHFGFSDSQTGNITNIAVGYCPMIYGINDEMFRRVLVHECVGHGFAKLLDEYSYQQMGKIPESEIVSYQMQQKELGWAMNVDFTSDWNTVLWKDFLKDTRYQGPDNYGESLGVYEGACTYWTGAWRSTNESMMRSNINGFNVPSRKAIYSRVMETGLGDSWIFNFEEFVEFDLSHLPASITRGVVNEKPSPKMFHAPIFTKIPIRIN